MDHGLVTLVERRGSRTVISVCGEIDVATSGQLREAIEPHLGPDRSIVLDLAGVGFMDSAFLDVVAQTRGRLTADGGSLILAHPSPPARRLLAAVGAEGLVHSGRAGRRSTNCRRRHRRTVRRGSRLGPDRPS
jgi:anti-anti-sigma factor